MTFPVPKDVRGSRPFELVRGMGEMLRNPAPIADMTQPLSPGEWIKLDAQGRVAKLTAADTPLLPAVGGFVCWTLFAPGNSYAGQSDVLATRQADYLSGPYQARTQFYDPTAAYPPGVPLVAVYDAANNRGVLSPVDLGSATPRQLAAVVAYVMQPPMNGQLFYGSHK